MSELIDTNAQIIQSTAKALEQGGALTGGGLGIWQLAIQHQDIILILCTVGSFAIGFLGYVTSSIVNWYFKNKHFKLAQEQARRKNDN